ncbi:Gfo/Idh/MocA family oxidoreductase [Oscillospiraceae bacterium MB08-C2-2]|nr:Gfo/Idh/MocA family oxidoreductase [Oscillospiraceae bacterium MB08-C2-2]
MQQKADGQGYAPTGEYKPVCSKGEFQVGIIGLDHGHIYGMCNGLLEAGATLHLVWDKSPDKIEAFRRQYPDIGIAACPEEILESDSIHLVASAGIPCDRGAIGIEALRHQKDFFSDKPPCTTLEQLEDIRRAVKETGRKFGVYYSERLHVEAATHAGALISQGAIGKVQHVMGWGPHRISLDTRPEWFFDPACYGGILTDIGCHQIEQILAFTSAKSAVIETSRVGNFAHPTYPKLQDFGDASITCDNGATGYFRVDWFTPAGLGSWGDGRVIIEGTEGYIEIRKYLDIARDPEGDHIYLVNGEGEYHFKTAGKAGFPFFGQFIKDCMERTELAMTQEHTFLAIELALQAQKQARHIQANHRQTGEERMAHAASCHSWSGSGSPGPR